MKKIKFFFIILMILLTSFLYAQENSDLPYEGDKGALWREIRDLTREKQNNKALEKLTLFIQLYPNDFDRAYIEIEKILEAKNRFYLLAEQLIQSCEENPEDSETPVKLLEEMELLELNPDEDTQKLITKLKGLHQFKYYDYLAGKLQTEAMTLAESEKIFNVGKKDILEPENYALDKLLDGFTKFPLYENDFNTELRDANPKLLAETYKILEDVEVNVGHLKDADFHKRLDQLVKDFIESVNNNDIARSNQILKEIDPYFQNYSNSRNNIIKGGYKINDVYNEQKEINPELTDASFLPFMKRLILGSKNSENQGILGILDYKYVNYVDSMLDAVLNNVNSLSEGYYNFLPRSLVSDRVEYESIYNTLNYISSMRMNISLGNSLFAYYEKLEDYDYSNKNCIKYAFAYMDNMPNSIITIARISQNLTNENNSQKNIMAKFDREQHNADFNQSDYVKYLFDSVAKLTVITGEKSNYLIDNKEWFQNYHTIDKAEKEKTIDLDKFTERYNNYLDEIFSFAGKRIFNSWERITTTYKNISDNFITEITPFVENNNYYNIGMDEKIPIDELKRIENNPKSLLQYAEGKSPNPDGLYRYPHLTIKLLDYINETCDNNITIIENYIKIINETLEEHKDWAEDEEIKTIADSTNLYLDGKKAELLGLKESTRISYQEANDNINAFRYTKNNADSLFEESKHAYEMGDFDKAEELLMSASEKFAEALGYSEDNELRLQIDKEKFDLSGKIANAKNEIVVKESRELYTKAKTAYNMDNFDEAEKNILAARNKWAETHTEENVEFESFWQLINTAVSMKTGRILLPSDPLYAEMSQILSSASLKYDEAVELLEKGKDEEGNAALNEAREYIVKIKSVYPLNEESALLLLKIERIQNPKLFEESFDQKIDEARELCYVPDKQMEGYNTLVNYYNLDPNYKNLKTILYNVEIDLGMRQKPVNNTSITQANRLLNEAQRLYNRAGTNQSQLDEAMRKVDQVLALNPNNKDAELLKDKIATKKGSSTVIVLSSEDEALLARAKNALTAGRIEDANVYMLQILQNPQNIKIKSVNDLKKRIDSRL